jgi:predicted secreted protein
VVDERFLQDESMKRTVLAAAAVASLTGTSLAQDAAEPDPVRLVVRPSGYQAEANEAKERQERLLRRLERSNHMVRSICTHCGDEWKHQIYAPFNPLASLGAGSRTAEEQAE